MSVPSTHYLLLTGVADRPHDEPQWQFVLQPLGNGERIAAEDSEPDADDSRLELLAVVRGLEALDGPTQVTLLCGSRYVRRGIRHDLAQWRESGWQWERFGQMVPIRDLDLWQRLDRALEIHQVECYFGLQNAEFGFENSLKNSSSEVRNPKSSRRSSRVSHQLAAWGHGVLSTLTAPGGAALSRSA